MCEIITINIYPDTKSNRYLNDKITGLKSRIEELELLFVKTNDEIYQKEIWHLKEQILYYKRKYKIYWL